MSKVPAKKVENATSFLNELARIAHKTDQRCNATQVNAVQDRDPDDVQNELDLLQATICRLGWLADLAAEELGSEAYRGDALAWMTPQNGLLYQLPVPAAAA